MSRKRASPEHDHERRARDCTRVRHASPPGSAPDGRVENWPSKFTGKTLPAGAAIEIAVPNSGGYGDPLERDPELVLSDVLDGFTALERAERDYDVVIGPDTRVDHDATSRLRARAIGAGSSRPSR